VLLPCRRAKLAKGAKVKEHAMPQQLSTTIAVIGVDIGKSSLTHPERHQGYVRYSA
jgi:hypothetical protein